MGMIEQAVEVRGGMTVQQGIQDQALTEISRWYMQAYRGTVQEGGGGGYHGEETHRRPDQQQPGTAYHQGKEVSGNIVDPRERGQDTMDAPVTRGMEGREGRSQ